MPTTLYTPDKFEQECISLLYTWLAENGFQNPDLPPIYLSTDKPPQFARVVQEWQEIFSDDIWGALTSDNNSAIELLNENQKNLIKEVNDGKVPWSGQERKILVGRLVSIDRVLGSYYSDTPYIILYEQGINASAQRHNVPTEMLRAVVLIHEIGHWISHAVPDSRGEIWVTAIFKKEKENVKEMWAQLFAYWIADEKSDFKRAFDALNEHQLEEYHKYKEMAQYDKITMFYALKYWHRFFPHLFNPEPPAIEEINKHIPVSSIRDVRKIYQEHFKKDHEHCAPVLKRVLIDVAESRQKIRIIINSGIFD